MWLFIIFLTWTSLKLTVSFSKNLHFCFISTSNLQEKGMGFLFLTTYFMFLRFIFLNLWVVFNIGFLGVSIMGLVIFVEFECIGLVVYAFKMLHFSVIIIVFLFWVSLLICNVLSMLSTLYCMVLCISCLLSSVSMTVTCISGVFIDYIVPTNLTHQCFSCLNATFLFHLPHLCAVSFYISIYTYFIN